MTAEKRVKRIARFVIRTVQSTRIEVPATRRKPKHKKRLEESYAD
jgi:hypothetical protein